MRTAKDGLSKHATKGYRLSLGKKQNGEYRTFWLGQDRAIAEESARLYRDHFAMMRLKDNRDVWTPADVEWVQGFIGEFKLGLMKLQQRQPIHIQNAEQKVREAEQKVEEAKQNVEREKALGNLQNQAFGIEPVTITEEAPEQPKQKTGPILYDAIKAYIDTMKGKNISGSHRSRASEIVDTTLKAVRPNCPLADIDRLWLDSLCDYFKSRPKSLKTGKPIKAATVATNLRYLRGFFNWLDDTGYGGWEAPRKMQKLFSVRTVDLMTPVERRAASVIEQFDIPTLVTLYQNGSAAQKTWMLTALFTGGTQTELAVLEKSEFDLDAGMLVHFRNKTGVEGKHWLPPELVTLLRAEFKKHQDKPLAFYTESGCPLVSFVDGNKTSDAVTLAWTRLRTKTEMPDCPSFKYLRKFVADYATRHGGESIGQVALSHARQTVLAKNYTTARDFDTFNDIQKKMYQEFVAAGMFNEPRQKAKTAAA